MMLIRATIPVDFYITGSNGEDLNLSTCFKYKKMNCSIVISGESIFNINEADSENNTIMHAEKLQIILEEGRGGYNLDRIIKSREYEEIISIITKVVNHCVQAIRNFGMVPHIHEILEDYPRAECILYFWSVQISNDNKEWTQIILNPSNLEQLKNYFSYKQPPSGRLEASKWHEIEKALTNDLKPSPEREFLTNSVENLKIKNYRLALIEAIIGLEIVLTRYLTGYMQYERHLSKTRINGIISPSLDLTTRVSVLLELIIEPEYLRGIDIEKILSAISWRNSVIHKTGNIPWGVTEKELKEAINEVLNLITLLGSLYDRNIKSKVLIQSDS